jgi:2-keto-4-pentenoate hydratase/2-oxohepta-3-ene-1,7-dioic acid hydratase in catechol pathway
MFRQGTRDFPGLVLDDAMVVDLSAANINAPATVQDLIATWDDNRANQLARIAADARATPPALKVADLKVLPPIMNPSAILMSARNFQEHAQEMAAAGSTLGTTTVIDDKVKAGLPGYWNRAADDMRPNPFIFPKLKGSLAADGDPVVLPPGRNQIDYECEIAAVIGKPAKNVPVSNALDYVFGYMLMVDVSDREDRADGRYGSDWFLGKSHDGFGPIGPYVTPKQFVDDVQNLGIKYTLNGEVRQDDRTSSMIHSMAELVAFTSNVITLQPGDILDGGTPGGVGDARVPPTYLKAGDSGVCTIEKLGTLRNAFVAAPGAAPATTN